METSVKLTYVLMQTSLLFICRYPGGAALSVLAIEVCAAPKGKDFEPFLSVTGYRMKPFWGEYLKTGVSGFYRKGYEF